MAFSFTRGLPNRAPRPTGAGHDLAASLALLTATLESTADGILVVSNEGRVLGHNTKFAQMWRVPESLFDSGSAAELIAYVLDQLADPAGFTARIAELGSSPDVVARDDIELADGRVFSRYSQPHVVAGIPTGRVWSFRDGTSERRLEQQLRKLAYHDDLTGLANRAMFMQRGRELALEAVTTGAPLAVAVLDLDHLKVVNDELGHQAGDDLLRVAAQRLSGSVRSGDLVARLGGDEFGVLMPDATAATAHAVAQRMIDAMAAPARLNGRGVSTSFSAGTSVATGDVSLETLLHEADLAMYRAKQDGRGRVRAYDGEVSRSAPRTVLAEIEGLLGDPNAVETALQPICDLATGSLIGHEALSRFPGREHREVGEWFALARETGHGPALEARSIAQALALHDRSLGTFLTINVSPAVLGSPEVMQVLSGDLSGVVVEVTEDSRLDLGQLLQLLQELRRRGAHVAMDDTGAGYDGLRRLVLIRPEVVKLDRELVHEIHLHLEKRAMVEALVSFCHQTGSTLCAEGIESVHELHTLLGLGVHLGQGWFIGRPAAGRTEVEPRAVVACGAVGTVSPGDLGPLREQLDQARTRFDVAGIAHGCVAALQVDDIVVSLLEGEELVLTSRPGVAFHRNRFELTDYPATAACLEGDKAATSIRTDDPGADPDEVRLLRESGYGAVLMLPLLSDERPIGLLEVYSRRQRSWTDRELRSCRYLADEVAAALDRVERGLTLHP